MREAALLHAGQPVAFLPNQGNAGDGLINRGAVRVLQRSGARVRTIAEAGDARAVFAVGAGAFSRAFPTNCSVLPPYFYRFDRVYIVSASFDPLSTVARRFLRSLPPHVTLFCREAHSHRYAREYTPFPEQVQIDHDLAFENDLGRWAARDARGVLWAFRRDAESVLGRPPPGNLDVSQLGNGSRYRAFLRILSGYKCVHTDRLHVAVAGALMRREVHLYPNAYWKNQGVYEYSLSGMPWVRFEARGARPEPERAYGRLRRVREIALAAPSEVPWFFLRQLRAVTKASGC